MQGFNMGRYYPPTYDPAKNPTLNSITGSHALGKRARKLGDGILIVRFELPFNVWCGGCEQHIGQGVRYSPFDVKKLATDERRCREEEGRIVLLDPDLRISLQVPSLRSLVRHPNGSSDKTMCVHVLKFSRKLTPSVRDFPLYLLGLHCPGRDVPHLNNVVRSH